MRQYLTWLEHTDKDGDAPPPSATKPASSSQVPAAVPAKPAAGPQPSAKPASNSAVPMGQPENRPKGVGIKATAAPAKPAVAAPLVVQPAARAMEPPATLDQFDVELVELPAATPPSKAFRLGKRDIMLAAIGGIVTLLLAGCCVGVSFGISRFVKGE